MNQNLKGKNVILTGVFGKLGRSVCKYINESGANVIALARLQNKKDLDLIETKAISDLFDCDVSEEKDFMNVLGKIALKYNNIDGLITCTSYRPMKLGLNDSLKNFTDSISKNSTAIFLPCREIGKIMCTQNYGSIVNISSIYGLGSPLKNLYEGTNITTEPDYPFIKGGTIALTKYLASFFAEYNVRVNAIASGGIYNNQEDNFLQNYSKRVPLKRMASEKDISNMIEFLISDNSAYVTGTVIPVDGGWSAT